APPDSGKQEAAPRASLLSALLAGRCPPPGHSLVAAARLLLEFLDQLRRLGLGHLVRDLLAGLLGESVDVRILSAGHRLVTGFPLLGILDRTAILGGLFLLRHGLTSSTMFRSASKSIWPLDK